MGGKIWETGCDGHRRRHKFQCGIVFHRGETYAKLPAAPTQLLRDQDGRYDRKS